jgi:hypothetical protein
MTSGRALAIFLLLAGCGGTSSSSTNGGGQAVNVTLTGKVLGGLLPAAGAQVQLYAANTSGGTTSTPLLAKAATAGADGTFSISGASCPSSALVYVLATGGQTGGASANTNLALATALGRCDSIAAGTSIAVNEVTTVAMTAAFNTLMVSATAVAGDQASLAAAFAASAVLANPATGVSPGAVAAGVSVPTSLINTLGNIIAPCVSSSGGSAGDLPQNPCGLLFSAATPNPIVSRQVAPTNTVGALLNIQENPLLVRPAVFGLQPPVNNPFLPALVAVPASFAVRVSSTNGVTISPLTVSFPDTAVGGAPAAAQQVTVTNSSSALLTLGQLTLAGDSFSLSGNTCAATLAAGQSCTVNVQFAPASKSALSAVLTVQSSAGDLSVVFSGNGT